MERYPIEASKRNEIKTDIDERTVNELLKLVHLICERNFYIFEAKGAYDLIEEINELNEEAKRKLQDVDFDTEELLVEFLYNLSDEEMVFAFRYILERLKLL